MATWITHLRIAENLLQLLPGLVDEEFSVGNIAPDSGIPDANWENFTPPGEVTHFAAPKGSSYHLADLKFYQEHLASLPWPGSTPDSRDNLLRYSFLLGYFCHLVTDNLHHELVGLPTHERFKAQFDAGRNFIWEVKKDWYGLDFEYVRDHPDSLYWRVFLHCSYPINYLDVLLPEGVRQRIEYIQRYYREINEHALERINHPRLYHTKAEADAFVENATQRLFEIINRLNGEKIDANGLWSALELPSSVDGLM